MMDIDINRTTCFTGHRPNKLYGYDPSSKGNRNILWKLRECIIDHIENKEVDTFITGMALGIDQWAGRIVLKLKETYPNIKLVGAIPCANHTSKWNHQSKLEWTYITDKCDHVYYVSKEDYTPWCMNDRNKWMVNNSKYVIAVWDGTKGGTGNCVNYAKKNDREITSLNPKTLGIN